MTISFYINKNDIQELYFLVDNFSIVPFDKTTRDKAVIVECFNSLDEVKNRLGIGEISNWRGKPMNSFIQVNIEYMKYEKIKEYLKF